MDAATTINFKAEVNALPTFLAAYDLSVYNYFNGISPTCVNFLDPTQIPLLSNSTTSTVAYLGSDSGKISSVGSMSSFVYEVFAIQRNSSLLSATKGLYYAQDTSLQQFELGEAAITISYALGNNPDFGIIV